MSGQRNKAQRSNIFKAARAVLWSFLGIRNKDEAQTDMANLSITQVIVVGIVGAVLFVITLVLLVNFVTR